MRDTVYFLAFDGYADCDAALALCEIRRPGSYRVQTVGLDRRPVLSLGGLRVLPDLAPQDIDPARAALLILPGGTAWERGLDGGAVAAARRLHAAGACVAGIGGGTLPLARAGLLDTRWHTSSRPGYLQGFAPDYAGTTLYDPGLLAVEDDRVISASGAGNVEFARAVIRALALYDEVDTAYWYQLYKLGVLPPWLAAGAATPLTEAA
ncbi:ThiJ/PfpI domain-containing protein [Mizugakiibacter sediminis]|uniref:ThiJ/PfpI domain-containing protein n=2 Tax=Mizugakiibacter sediminis TaxID=1475481 RepID=A0A0K8QKV0_9GAMM|nr:DJ-1/PfpI family protein [Mizugakiibacter sediminis]GAP65296.1 ThiJ/PfpI domain-containing protein [Mizugakiibacter sediminis]